MESYLRDGKTDAERYSALRVLCRYWSLWDAYLPFLFSKLGADSWEADYAIADEAMTLLGQYLHLRSENKTAWQKLLDVYDDALAQGDNEKAEAAYSAALVALKGEHEALREQLARKSTKDTGIIRAARDRAKLS